MRLTGVPDTAGADYLEVWLMNGAGTEIVALGAIFLFGWLLERRHGAWAPLLVFLVGGAAGMFLAIAGDDIGFVANGGNGAAAGTPATAGGDAHCCGGPAYYGPGGGGGGLGRIRINTPDRTYVRANTAIEAGATTTGTLSTR